ncbi:MAG: hypothetical protein R3E96_07460 [Planctomycetota bacterium]
MHEQRKSSKPLILSSEDRHLCFVLDGGQFAVQILQVQRDHQAHPITSPGLGAEVRGVINLRMIIPCWTCASCYLHRC